jgi:hypothetical protein
MARKIFDTIKVETATQRDAALEILRSTYKEEKGWVKNEETLLSESDLASRTIAWFLTSVNHKPAGVLRVLYDPSFAEYAAYDLKLRQSSFDVNEFLRNNKIAEIGRFAVVVEYRSEIKVVLHLMRAATEDTVRRGYSHYITDVFEGEEHSPYEFHTKVVGFQPVATHDTGEMNCNRRRITLVLNLREAYQRLRRNGNAFYRFITQGWDETMHHALSTP